MQSVYLDMEAYQSSQPTHDSAAHGKAAAAARDSGDAIFDRGSGGGARWAQNSSATEPKSGLKWVSRFLSLPKLGTPASANSSDGSKLNHRSLLQPLAARAAALIFASTAAARALYEVCATMMTTT